jgi:CheY-like chemotaxis protein
MSQTLQGCAMAPPVLVVDDDPAILASIQAILRLHGVDCRTARDGVEAQAAAAMEEPSLILLDMNMPGMGGIEALRQLRARRVDAPAVLMTATAADVQRLAFEAGFDAYLPKPFLMSDVATLLDRFVGLTDDSPDESRARAS